MYLRAWLFVLIYLLYPEKMQAQTIINTSSIAHDLDSGYSAIVNFSGNFSSGNLTLYDLALNVLIGKSISTYSSIWIHAGSNQLKTEDNQIANTHFVHIRNNYRLNSRITAQGYFQWQRNDILLFERRQLIGANLNFDISNRNQYISLGTFHETEIYPKDIPTSQIFRGNLLLVIKRKNNRIQWATLLFVQPSLKNASDFRAIWNSDINYEINDNFSIGLALNGRHDSEPHGELQRHDLNLLTSLTYNL